MSNVMSQMSQMDLDLIRQLREQTGVSIGEITSALKEGGGDVSKVLEILKRRGELMAVKKSAREAKNGIIDAYIHANGKAGALVELRCETDFVARNPEFKNLAHDIGMQIVAMHPFFVKSDDVPEEIIHGEREIFRSQAADSGKPAHIANQIVEGKLKKYLEEICLLSQPFIKNQDETVQDQINKLIAKLGENITVGKFARFEI